VSASNARRSDAPPATALGAPSTSSTDGVIVRDAGYAVVVLAIDADLQWYEIVARLTVAAVLGAVVGLERESSGQDAGFRTHLLLALGAALFGVVSIGAFDAFITDQPTNSQVDVTRIASYVAAGVGFIGGGVILKHAGAVRGITTATSLWTAAAVGLAAGVGFWVGALTATVLALVALALLKPLSDWIGRRSHPPRSLVIVVRNTATGAAVLNRVHEIATTSVRSVQLGEGNDNSTELAVQFWTSPDDHVIEQLVERLDAEFGADVSSVSLRS
jgi:putative Mg2+ transporter-C (MgtC) family protein